MAPADIQLQILDSRRLTGPGLLWSEPGAIIDVLISGIDGAEVATCWRQQLHRIFEIMSWPDTRNTVRFFDSGASLVIAGPLDSLYTACEVNELAFRLTRTALTGEPEADLATLIEPILKDQAEELNPALLNLQAEAARQNACFLWDDDEVSIGSGKHTQIWPTHKLPSTDQVNWHHTTQIPCGLITGTNGKTTSVRLAAYVAKAGSISAGFTSTDSISVAGKTIEEGDFSGPGGARTLMRHPQVEMAFLEVARGGMLRRGLPLKTATAALITNVAEDHLGEYGVNTLAEMTEAKFIVSKALGEQAVLVLNADDGNIVAHMENNDVRAKVCWFSLTRNNITLLRHLEEGGTGVYSENSQLVYHDGVRSEPIVNTLDVPLTLDGAASYNISNCLGVIGLTKAMDLPTNAIATGLREFQNDITDNPGRANQFNYKGARIFVDFAHNPHALKAVVKTLNNLTAKRRLVMLGHAGDRSDQDIRNLTFEACRLNPDQVVVADLPDYLRGREEGEVSRIICQQLTELDIKDEQIHRAGDPLQGALWILDWIREGDLVLLLALSHRDEIVRLLSPPGETSSCLI